MNGDGEIRTLDPLLARQVLSQLSYTPMSPSLCLLQHDCRHVRSATDHLLLSINNNNNNREWA